MTDPETMTAPENKETTTDPEKPKTKEQIAAEERIAAEKKRVEDEKNAIATSRSNSGLCPCMEICVDKELHCRDARKKLRVKRKDTAASCLCHCESVCVDDTLVETNFTRAISRPPYTNWSGILTCRPDSIYAARLTKTIDITHNNQAFIRGTWSSPEPDFWIGNILV